MFNETREPRSKGRAFSSSSVVAVLRCYFWTRRGRVTPELVIARVIVSSTYTQKWLLLITYQYAKKNSRKNRKCSCDSPGVRLDRLMFLLNWECREGFVINKYLHSESLSWALASEWVSSSVQRWRCSCFTVCRIVHVFVILLPFSDSEFWFFSVCVFLCVRCSGGAEKAVRAVSGVHNRCVV